MEIEQGKIDKAILETKKIINKSDNIIFSFISEYEKERFSGDFEYENYIYLFTNSFIIGRRIDNTEGLGDNRIVLDIYNINKLRKHIKVTFFEEKNRMIVDLGEFKLISTKENVANLNEILKHCLLKIE